ncbi:MAG: cupin domain-containing protein [Dehalococcoidia bacterium]
MPIVPHSDLPLERPSPTVATRTVVKGEMGAASLTVTEVMLEPGGQIPLHIHPSHEEAIIVLEGTLEATVGDEVRTVGAGTTVLAPQAVRHKIRNGSGAPARILGIFPTLQVQRQFLE